MSEIDIFEKMNEIATTPQFSLIFGENSEQARKIAEHRDWLKSIRHERPNTEVPFKVGIYIRYFNQTRYDNYLAYHKKQFADTVALCPKWTLVDFYIDEGSTAPNMETAPAWSQLLEDCFDGKIDLIITQKSIQCFQTAFRSESLCKTTRCPTASHWDLFHIRRHFHSVFLLPKRPQRSVFLPIARLEDPTGCRRGNERSSP